MDPSNLNTSLNTTVGTVAVAEAVANPISSAFYISNENENSGAVFTSRENKPFSSFYMQFAQQIKLLLWKRNLELKNQKYERAKYIIPPLLSFVFLLLLYNAFDIFGPGTLEVSLVF